jgi:hypothetical protein
MTPAQLKVLFVVAAALLLLALGGGAGVWLAAGHYRPLLDVANGQTTTCTAARNNLVQLTQEQSQKLGDLAQQAKDRAADAAKAVATAQEQAKTDYGEANRIQQEHIGGDSCAAATTVIDKELGL